MSNTIKETVGPVEGKFSGAEVKEIFEEIKPTHGLSVYKLCTKRGECDGKC